MGGFGSMSSMNSSLKDNRRLLKEKKSFKDRKSVVNKTSSTLRFNQMSSEERVAFAQHQKREKRRTWMSISILGIVIVALTGIFIAWIGSV